MEVITAALNLVMHNIIFKFGDSFFEEISGCKMGMPVAFIYATLYYAYHERKMILPKYSANVTLLKRFVNDIIGIWVPNGDPDAWQNFKRDLSYGTLTWDPEDLTKKVNFLDLTMTMNSERRIETRTYQKAMHVYVYLPPHSAHPPSVIRVMVYGLLRKYKEQNTHRKHYIEIAVLIFQRLVARGWDRALLQSIFKDATERLEIMQPSKLQERKKIDDNQRRRQIFIHTEYHRGGMPRKEIRQAFRATCGDAFRNLETEDGGMMQIEETIIAYCIPVPRTYETCRPQQNFMKFRDGGFLHFPAIIFFGFYVCWKNVETQVLLIFADPRLLQYKSSSRYNLAYAQDPCTVVVPMPEASDGITPN